MKKKIIASALLFSLSTAMPTNAHAVSWESVTTSVSSFFSWCGKSITWLIGMGPAIEKSSDLVEKVLIATGHKEEAEMLDAVTNGLETVLHAAHAVKEANNPRDKVANIGSLAQKSGDAVEGFLRLTGHNAEANALDQLSKNVETVLKGTAPFLQAVKSQKDGLESVEILIDTGSDALETALKATGHTDAAKKLDALTDQAEAFVRNAAPVIQAAMQSKKSVKQEFSIQQEL